MYFGSQDGSLMIDDEFSVDHIAKDCPPTCNSARKRGRGGESKIFSIFGADSLSLSGEEDRNENDHPNMMHFPGNSQDSFASQSSQDFSDRFSCLMKGGISFSQEDNQPIHSEDTNLSSDGFSIPFPPTLNKSKAHLPRSRGPSTSKNSDAFQDAEKQIPLNPPLQNPFLSCDEKQPRYGCLLCIYEMLPRLVTKAILFLRPYFQLYC